MLVADLTDAADVARVAARVADEPRLELLVNNAGFSGYGPFAELDPGVMAGVVAIHVTTPVTLIRAALPGMIARGAGAVVNVASLLSLSGPLRLGMSGRATYAGAKSFQLVFIQALAAELEGTVCGRWSVCPAWSRASSTVRGRSPGGPACRRS